MLAHVRYPSNLNDPDETPILFDKADVGKLFVLRYNLYNSVTMYMSLAGSIVMFLGWKTESRSDVHDFISEDKVCGLLLDSNSKVQIFYFNSALHTHGRQYLKRVV